jgi:hypothetical protein
MLFQCVFQPRQPHTQNKKFLKFVTENFEKTQKNLGGDLTLAQHQLKFFGQFGLVRCVLKLS